MHQIPFKAMLWPVIILILVLFGIGVLQIKRPEYACFNGKNIHFNEKVEIVSIGALRINAFPLMYDCVEEDRYDPEKFKLCGKELCERE